MKTTIYQAKLQSFLEGSHEGGLAVSEELVQKAGEEFKAALRKQFQTRDPEFRIRMSNIGRPQCVLKMEKSGATPTPKSAKFILQMLLGDAMECIMRLAISAAGINTTSHGDKVTLDVLGQVVKGDSDIDLDGKVYDIKSTSDWAYNNKWAKGFSALYQEDPFGYVGQLVGYADAQNKEPGGWVVGNKSTGEFLFVPFEATDAQLSEIRAKRESLVRSVVDNEPFERCYKDEEETYLKKPTGSRLLPFSCKFCDFMKTCWPDAKFLPQTEFRGKGYAPMKWYTEYAEKELNGDQPESTEPQSVQNPTDS